MWTWAPQQNVAFVNRRMAQETAVHRWDAQHAVGGADRLEPSLAATGIDEFVEVMVPDDPPVVDQITIVAADAAATWIVGDPAGSAATLTGPASDLLLVLWRRLPATAVDISGDRAAAERFVHRTELE